MTKAGFVICIMTLASVAKAHDSNLATFQIRQLEGFWLYEVMTPLYGLDQSLRASLSDDPEILAKLVLGSVEYKQQIVAHLKEGFEVSARTAVESEEMELSLGQGRIKLDDHMSTLVFEIRGMPEAIGELEFRIANMSHNPNQNNLLRLIKGDRTERYFLNASNDFSGEDLGFFRQ